MDLELYSIFDRVTGVYSAPFCSVNEESAKRYFSAIMKGKVEEKDAELYHVGTFETRSGFIDTDPCTPARFIMRAEVSGDEK